MVKMRAEDDFREADDFVLFVRVQGASGVDLNTYVLTVTGDVACGANDCAFYNP